MWKALTQEIWVYDEGGGVQKKRNEAAAQQFLGAGMPWASEGDRVVPMRVRILTPDNFTGFGPIKGYLGGIAAESKAEGESGIELED